MYNFFEAIFVIIKYSLDLTSCNIQLIAPGQNRENDIGRSELLYLGAINWMLDSVSSK